MVSAFNPTSLSNYSPPTTSEAGYIKRQQISSGQTVWFQIARCENQKKAKYHLDVRFWGKVFAEGNTLTMKVSECKQNDSTDSTKNQSSSG